MYDYEAQTILNEQALENPQAGDYWQEMFCPYFLVVKVKGDAITVLSCMMENSYTHPNELNARIDNKDGPWSFDYSKHFVVDKHWLEKTVKYSSIPGFVADVVRGEKMKRIVKEWKDFHLNRLLELLSE